MSERIALVHDYLNQRGGAERVFAHIAAAFPEAPVYTALFTPSRTGDLVDPRRVRTSALQALPAHDRYFRLLAPLYPAAFEAFDLSGYDLIISSTTAWAKGVRTRPDALHLCYINTVSRFAFAYDRYVRGLGGPADALARPIVARLVAWDRAAAQRPTAFVANSRNVAERVRRYYDRDAHVLHCPVDVARFTIGTGRGRYFLVVSRLLPYKRIDLAIDGCALAGVPLLIAGTGPAEDALRARARGTGAHLLGYVPDAELARLVGDARAVILPGEEDFGLVPLEANAAGRPVIAFRGGGALETVREGVTGAFFDAPEPASLAAVLRDFDAGRYDPATLRAHAERFAPSRFIAGLRAIVAIEQRNAAERRDAADRSVAGAQRA